MQIYQEIDNRLRALMNSNRVTLACWHDAVCQKMRDVPQTKTCGHGPQENRDFKVFAVVPEFRWMGRNESTRDLFRHLRHARSNGWSLATKQIVHTNFPGEKERDLSKLQVPMSANHLLVAD